ncbi:hypothetical protein BX600DRAFT_511828 [Xylariales sp. PMI_506]|nr:hypothetical protein BX600DRAFT_511828 [Xylariales sp. PMI_506]
MESESRVAVTPRVSSLADASSSSKPEISSTDPSPYWYKLMSQILPMFGNLVMVLTHILALFLTPASLVCDSNDYVLIALDAIRVAGFSAIAFGLVIRITIYWEQEWLTRHSKNLIITSTLIGFVSFSFSICYPEKLTWLYNLFVNTCREAAQGHTYNAGSV